VLCMFSGDFGGYFGLLLGGSIMSLFEIFDLIMYNAFVKMTSRKTEAQDMHVRNLAEEQV